MHRPRHLPRSFHGPPESLPKRHGVRRGGADGNRVTRVRGTAVSYRVAYGPGASKALDSMPASPRQSFDRATDAVARDPDGSGSSAVRGERGHRDAAVAGASSSTTSAGRC
ncbi:hypothetical protein GCM10023205_40070 [Yinghuangia aomiensis]|uniref:Uncharacterized protein n=1 Tax=Yinghuangia aomiensis TaxID=676205 RepID=A0ABP9HH14_9ACTN